MILSDQDVYHHNRDYYHQTLLVLRYDMTLHSCVCCIDGCFLEGRGAGAGVTLSLSSNLLCVLFIPI